MKRQIWDAALGMACLLGPWAEASAAGGHHAVDDATILDPDACQVELWIDRAADGRGTLLHAGPACRVGPVELGLNLDRFHADGSGTATAGVLQLKWARELLPGLSAGIALAAGVRDHSPNFLGTSVVIPLTWQASESLRVHVNAGRDFVHSAADFSRSGAAVEWNPSERWSLLAERFREVGLDFWRVGVRYAPQPDFSVDLSRAEGMAGAPDRWALGLNFSFGR